jgi:hypothetical protein
LSEPAQEHFVWHAQLQLELVQRHARVVLRANLAQKELVVVAKVRFAPPFVVSLRQCPDIFFNENWCFFFLVVNNNKKNKKKKTKKDCAIGFYASGGDIAECTGKIPTTLIVNT